MRLITTDNAIQVPSVYVCVWTTLWNRTVAWSVAGRRIAAGAGVGVHIENNRGGCFDARRLAAMSQMRIWINEQKKEKNLIRRSVDYKQDLTNQIQLCKFLVGDTPSG